jgi:hypothetical protein
MKLLFEWFKSLTMKQRTLQTMSASLDKLMEISAKNLEMSESALDKIIDHPQG